ncbi:MAG TPA: hypothetical protein VMU50_06715 [Polyangia bacterium]|nr:hypothetical protein [Polyangia bacterium]
MRTAKIVSCVSATRFLVLGAALSAAGCGANLAPVLTINHAPVVGTPAGVDQTAYVHDAIVRAVASRGWVVAQDVPGMVVATIHREALFVTVEIPYTATDYSIIHRESSPEFKFDGQRVHKHYNHWVDRLRASITAELLGPGAAKKA